MSIQIHTCQEYDYCMPFTISGTHRAIVGVSLFLLAAFSVYVASDNVKGDVAARPKPKVVVDTCTGFYNYCSGKTCPEKNGISQICGTVNGKCQCIENPRCGKKRDAGGNLTCGGECDAGQTCRKKITNYETGEFDCNCLAAATSITN